MSAVPGQPDLRHALDKLWLQFLPQMHERVSAIDDALSALSLASLTPDQRAAANSAAHKLAGVLGTFGLTQGTDLAREAELLFGGELGNVGQNLPRLQEISAQLRAIIASRQ